jgi:two-component sensor histidine kinase/ligand-binding sensor domain-containing protein
MIYRHFLHGILWAFTGTFLSFHFSALAQNGSTANKQDYIINKRILSTEDGLASHEVFCGVQDGSGFLWFGTRNGLNRYDGINCLLFTRQRNNLQDNKVVQLAKDNANHLFIEYGSTGFQLTTNGKVDVMNSITQEVTTLSAAFPGMPFKEQDVYWIANDGTDQINFLTAYPFRLWKYSPARGFTLYYEMKDWNNISNSSLTDYRSSGPMCLFGQGKSLLKISNQSTQYFLTKDTVISFTQHDALRSLPLGFTAQNELLIAYNTSADINAYTIGMITRSGTKEFPSETKKFNTDSIKGRYWYLSTNSVEGQSCALYIATDAIYLWNENAFLKVLSKSELRSFENLFLYRLFNDNFGNYWLCTSLGVVQLRIEKNRFIHYFTSKQQTSESNSQARGIYADDSGLVAANIWMHTFLQKDNKQRDAVTHGEIKYALVYHHSTLYCGGYNLYSYDEAKNKLATVPGSAGSEIWSMYSLNDSLLLLGRTDGFSVFNSAGNKFDSITYDSPAPEAVKFVYRFFKGNDDTLWAVAENGLYKLSEKNGKWSILNIRSAFLRNLSLYDAYIDAGGIFWLTTNSEGLYRWDRKTDSIQQFNLASGLPSDILYRIEADDHDNLWISSDYGLIRFSRKTYAVNTYTTSGGISHNEFNRTSSFKSTDGRLFFGGIDGVNAFRPNDFVTDTDTLNVPLRIISFSQYAGATKELVNRTTALLNTSQIRLEPGDQFFTLEFQLLDFVPDETHHYAYRIEGVDKDWNYINENSIRISGLPYGHFMLKIKAQNREGTWSESELHIPLTVLKPFYLKWWFIVLVIVGVVAAVYRFILFRTKQLAAEKNRLEKTVNERTAQLRLSLSEQAELLEEKDILVKEIHHRVKNNLQVISGLLELQSKSLADDIAKDALMEGRNRVRSIALIHQNLYQYELSNVELCRFTKELCGQVESVFNNRKKVTMNIDVPDLHLDIDSAVPLGLIMNELLSNSFKYAFNEESAGNIYLSIHTIAEGKYQLVYGDNGPGLPEGFDFTKATTLGIQLINDLSRQIGGHVHYENKNGAAYTILFTNRNRRKNED